MADLERFAPLPDLDLPAGAYALVGVERGEELCGRVPTGALAEITTRGRTPLTIEEGVALVLQFPAAPEKNKCFSLAGSRPGTSGCRRCGSALRPRCSAGAGPATRIAGSEWPRL